MAEPKLEWTQYEIFEEAKRRHGGDPDFFNNMNKTTDEDFGLSLEVIAGEWEFEMGKLTVGKLLEFFAGKPDGFSIVWHKGGVRGRFACVAISDYDLAEAYRSHFKERWLTTEELQRVHRNDYG
jgi:hypothetical protein